MTRDEPGLPNGTVTFLFADIERSTELTRRFGAGFGDVRSRHRRVLRESFDRHEGNEMDNLESHATQALLVGTLADAGLRDLGERVLMDGEAPIRVYDVSG